MSKAVKERKFQKRQERRSSARMAQIEAKLKAEKEQMGEAQWEAKQAINLRMRTASFGGLYDI